MISDVRIEIAKDATDGSSTRNLASIGGSIGGGPAASNGNALSSWNAEDFEYLPGEKKRKVGGGTRLLRSLPRTLRWALLAAACAAVTLIPVACIMHFCGVGADELVQVDAMSVAQLRNGHGARRAYVRGVLAEACRWLFLACTASAGLFVCKILTISLPTALVQLFTRESTDNRSRFDYYLAIGPHMAFLATSVLAIGVFAALFRHAHDDGWGYQPLVYLALCCVAVATAVAMVQKFAVQLIAVKFHQTAYEDRIAELKAQLQLLAKLNAVVHRKTRKRGFNAAAAAGAGAAAGLLSSAGLGFGGPRPLTPQSSVEAAPARGGEAAPRSGEAAKEGRRIFAALWRSGSGSNSAGDTLTVDDFVAAYEADAHADGDAREEAQRCFALFDRDGNGDVSRAEMSDCVAALHRERRNLGASLRDLNSAVGKLDRLFSGISAVFVLFICIMLFNKNKDVLNHFVSFSGFVSKRS